MQETEPLEGHVWNEIDPAFSIRVALYVTRTSYEVDEVLKAIDWVEVSLTGSWGLFGSVASYMSDPNSRVEGCTFRRRCDEITKCSKMSSWA